MFFITNERFTIHKVPAVNIWQNRSLCYCPSGAHLETCENFTCPGDTFKCPNQYCVKLRYLCDGHWDCSQGYDEDTCLTSNIPGYFKCKNSNISISLLNICDRAIDCPNLDDELFCELNEIQCPINCTCLLYSISCERLLGIPWTIAKQTLPYVSVVISDAIFLKDMFPYKILNQLDNLAILSITNSNIASFKLVVNKNHLNLQDINFSHNVVSKMSQKCLGTFPHLTQFSVAANKIQDVACYLFNSSKNLLLLNLTHNKLTHLKDCTFAGIARIRFFDISNNLLMTLGENTFRELEINNIKTSSHIVCCVISNVHGCNQVPPWPFSCDSLLADSSMKVIIWFNGIVGCLSNLFSFIRQIYNIKKQINTGFSIGVLSITIPDFYYSFGLLLLAAFDVSFGSAYATRDYTWRQSIGCQTIAFLFLFSSYCSLTSINLLTISRYDVVRNPMDSNFKDLLFCCRIQIGGFFMSFTTSLVLLILYLNFEGGWKLPIGLCFLAGKSEKGFIQMLITVFLIVLQLISSCFISILYGLVAYNVRKSAESVKSTGQSRDKSLFRKVIITCVTNITCWVPSSCVFLISVTMSQYAYKVLVWTVISIMSINAITNPWILNVDSLGVLFKTILQRK